MQIDLFLEHLRVELRGQRTVELVMDNVSSTNKNAAIVCFCHLLMWLGVVQCVRVNYLAEYHGKCYVDGAFGMCCVLY